MSWLGYVILIAVAIFVIYEIITLVKTIKEKKKRVVSDTETSKTENVCVVPESIASVPTDIVVADDSNNNIKEEEPKC